MKMSVVFFITAFGIMIISAIVIIILMGWLLPIISTMNTIDITGIVVLIIFGFIGFWGTFFICIFDPEKRISNKLK